jgi:hypothetical protein
MSRMLLTALAVLGTRLACADGGVPIDSRMVGSERVTLLMTPARPSVGSARFTLLGHGGGPAEIQVRNGDHRERTALEAEPGRPGLHAQLDFAVEGPALVTVHAGAATEPLLQSEVTVGPQATAWMARWPWILAWLPMLGLVTLREWLLARRLHSAQEHDASKIP